MKTIYRILSILSLSLSISANHISIKKPFEKAYSKEQTNNKKELFQEITTTIASLLTRMRAETTNYLTTTKKLKKSATVQATWQTVKQSLTSMAYGLLQDIQKIDEALLPSANEKIIITEQKPVLRHLACIMDGNRRWATTQGVDKIEGHKQGVNPVKTAISFCLKNNIKHLSLYAFSLENLKRSAQEQEALFNLLEQELQSPSFTKLFEHGVRLRFIGDQTVFPEKLRITLSNLEKQTENNTTLIVDILFCYGGQQEIVAATKQIARKVKENLLTLENIDEQVFSQHLWTHGDTKPDLIIRTGGSRRLSNFLTYQSAYSELYFTDTFWPDLSDEHLAEAIAYYDQCKRNFGK